MTISLDSTGRTPGLCHGRRYQPFQPLLDRAARRALRVCARRVDFAAYPPGQTRPCEPGQERHGQSLRRVGRRVLVTVLRLVERGNGMPMG